MPLHLLLLGLHIFDDYEFNVDIGRVLTIYIIFLNSHLSSINSLESSMLVARQLLTGFVLDLGKSSHN